MRFEITPVMICVSAAALAISMPAASQAPEGADTCVECHGENGVSTDPTVPTIAGASPFFLENQLIIYQEEARPCAESVFEKADPKPADNHCALAQDLSEEQVTALAEHFADQQFRPAAQSFNAAMAETGASLHDRHCDKCHTDAGTFTLDDAGILAGQWKEYLAGTMKDYVSGGRWQPEKMQPKVEELSDDDVKALLEYYAREGEQRWDTEPVKASK